MTKRIKLALAATLVLGATGVSLGGYRTTQEVNVYSAGYYSGAQGNVTDVRNSADTIQYIQCEAATYTNGGTPYVTCIARNAAGQYASCYATNAPQAMVDQVLSIGPRSTIHFSYSASSGYCQWIRVMHGSQTGGMSNTGVAQ